MILTGGLDLQHWLICELLCIGMDLVLFYCFIFVLLFFFSSVGRLLFPGMYGMSCSDNFSSGKLDIAYRSVHIVTWASVLHKMSFIHNGWPLGKSSCCTPHLFIKKNVIYGGRLKFLVLFVLCLFLVTFTCSAFYDILCSVSSDLKRNFRFDAEENKIV